MVVQKSYNKKNRSRKYIKLAALLLVLAIAVMVVLELTNVTHFFHTSPATSGKIPVISTAPKTSKSTAPAASKQSTDSAPTTTSANGSSSNKSTSGSPTTTSAGSTQPLQAPFGAFVSNHSPNLSGSPAPSTEQSVCNTTPGASCTMYFTNDSGIVKTLPSQTSDGNGNVTWLWDVKTAGFTAGNWQIKATATLNGVDKSSIDHLPLKVQS